MYQRIERNQRNRAQGRQEWYLKRCHIEQYHPANKTHSSPKATSPAIIIRKKIHRKFPTPEK
jgi:hypothetical protein